jgi:GT2 family glycosyltransferase
VILPTLDGDRSGNLTRLLSDIAEQTLTDVEVIVVEGVRPNGRARNLGAARARGRYLVFIDDDVRLGHPGALANLVGALERNHSFGLVGPSQLVPPDATRFQRAVARQLPRTRFPVVADATETDMVTHMCLAIPADLWRAVGGEHDDLVRGTDPDLRNRVRRAGRRVLVVPGTWAYHPPPTSLGALLRSSWRGGRGAAWVRRHHPDLAFDVPDGPFTGSPPVRRGVYRLGRFGARLLTAVVRGRFLLAAADLAYAAGYISFLLARREPWTEELA